MAQIKKKTINGGQFTLVDVNSTTRFGAATANRMNVAGRYLHHIASTQRYFITLPNPAF